MSGGREFQADEPEFLFCKHINGSELSKRICKIPEYLALTHFPAFETERIRAKEVVFLDERMNAWRFTYTRRLCRNGSTSYTLRGGWQQVFEDKEVKSKDCVCFFRFKQSHIFIFIRQTTDKTFELLESKSRRLILLHPNQVNSAKLLASRVSKAKERFAMEYIACIYGMFEAGASQIQQEAASSTASPTLSLQDFEAIYRILKERAEYNAGPTEFEEYHLPPRIPRNFSGQDFYRTYSMMEERRKPRLNRAGSATSMALQIPHPTSINSSEHLAPQISCPTSTSSSGHLSQSNFQLSRIQTQAMGEPSFPAYPVSYNQSSTNHSGRVSQLRPSPYIQIPRNHFGYDPQMFQSTGAQIQVSAPSFLASQNQYQTPRSFSGQLSGAQTQVGAPSLMASQIQHGTLSSSSGQFYLPSYGMVQERGAPNQEAAKTCYVTIGTQIQAQQEDHGGSGDPHGEGGTAEE
ncbi:hypothetical protein SUGI_1028340 [Cryptomeria japonica]|nr:hypothetical protein SUGI_1028340 [Cryptomeria japonica]